MAIIVKAEGNGAGFQPHPEGQFAGVCIDVHDLGLQETQFGLKPKLDIFFYCGEDKQNEDGTVTTNEDGSPVHLYVRQRFTASLHPKSLLRPFLAAWRGRDFTDEEEEGFDVECLIGAPALLQITHAEVGDRVFANISSVMRLPKGMKAPAIPDDYVRMQDRPPRDGPPPAPAPAPPPKASSSAQRVRAQAKQEPPPNPGRPWDDDDDLPF